MHYLKTLVATSVCSAVLLAAPAAHADEALALTDLSLEELFAQEVSSVAKRPQNVKEASAAVFVIGREDIRRTGATTIPELLRMVPGIEVAELSDQNFAVTARGFNGRFANKLLVLVDGRAIYISAASGVLWDQQLVPVEDIERIEVVRGPGATLWGANAVNGVINVITKHAIDTQGGAAAVSVDDGDSQRLHLRQGVRLGETGLLRLSAHGRRDNRTVRFGTARGVQEFEAGQLGVRYDAQPTMRDAVTLQADLSNGGTATGGLSVPGIQDGGGFKAGNALARWTRLDESGGGRIALQGYYDHVKQTDVLTRRLFRLDFSKQFTAGENHDIVWGLGYARIENRAAPMALLTFEDSDQNWVDGFVQDDISLMADRLKVSVGAKVEHNPRTGFEVQPSVRAIWLDPAGWSAWASVSRAVRTPSDFEADGSVDLRPFQPVLLTPAPAKSETLLAYELGWRGRLSERVTLDATAFYNQYDGLLGTRGEMEFRDGAPVFVFRLANMTAATTYGAEVSLTAQLTPNWRMQASGSLLDSDIDPITGIFTSLGALSTTQSPKVQASVRSMLDLRDDLDLDLWVRHVGELTGNVGDPYTDLDVRLAWRPTGTVELFALGENLLEKERVEFLGGVSVIPLPEAVVDRRLRVGLKFQY